MKRIVSLILVTVLLAALCSTALAAINTQYSSTRLFLDTMKAASAQRMEAFIGGLNKGI